MANISHYQISIPAAQAAGATIEAPLVFPIPARGGAVRVRGIRVVAPGTGVDTQIQRVYLSQQVGHPAVFVDAWGITDSVQKGAGIHFTPGSLDPASATLGSLDFAVGDEDVPLCVVYANPSGVEPAGDVRIDVILERA